MVAYKFALEVPTAHFEQLLTADLLSTTELIFFGRYLNRLGARSDLALGICGDEHSQNDPKTMNLGHLDLKRTSKNAGVAAE